MIKMVGSQKKISGIFACQGSRFDDSYEEWLNIVSTFAGQNYIEDDRSVRNLMRDKCTICLKDTIGAGLEAGINAGLFVNSNKQTKPILMEYHRLYYHDGSVYETR